MRKKGNPLLFQREEKKLALAAKTFLRYNTGIWKGGNNMDSVSVTTHTSFTKYKKPVLLSILGIICLLLLGLFLSARIYYQDMMNEHAPQATIELTEDGFKIIPKERIFYFDETASQVIAKLAALNPNGTFLDSICAAAKKRAAADENLKAECARLNRIYQHKISLDMTGANVTLDASTFKNWLTYQNGQIAFNPQAVDAYVNNLAKQYDTFYTERNFKDVSGKTRKVGGTGHDTYGFWLDGAATKEKILQALTSETDVNLQPVWRVQANTRQGLLGTDINNTYIEVDISKQHMWYFKDGKLVIDTDVVTGKESDPKRKTPDGLYQVLTKAKDYKMSGSYGSSFCHYWIAISWDGVGIHDLGRSVWGGNEYISNGSHGCINTPIDAVKVIFDSVPEHTPVIVYRS